jgi:hypothetical protein
MDKAVDSGSTDAGSIPARGAKFLNTSVHAGTGVYYLINNRLIKRII